MEVINFIADNHVVIISVATSLICFFFGRIMPKKTYKEKLRIKARKLADKIIKEGI